MDALRPAARIGAHAIVVLLAAVWATAGLASLSVPLFDLGRARIGDAILAFAGALHMAPAVALDLAHSLAWIKILLGGYLLVTVMLAIRRRLSRSERDDALLDVGLFLAAVSSTVAALPALAVGGEALQGAIGELLLCVFASALASFGRGPRESAPALGRS